MKVENPNIVTPIYVKDEEFVWPDDETVFYLLSSDGLFICRNNKWFRSCVEAKRPPSELEGQAPFLHAQYPKIPTWMMEQVMGWFTDVAHKFHCEAAALFIWDEDDERVKLFIPKQTGKVTKRYAMDVVYEIPQELPAHQRVIGTIHSHVFSSAYSSWTDKDDEAHFPGVHIVLGKLDQKEPDVHAVIVADGTHFKVNDINLVAEPFKKRRHDYAKWWWDKMHCEVVAPPKRVYSSSGNWQQNLYGGGHGGNFGFGEFHGYGEGYGSAAHQSLRDMSAEDMDHVSGMMMDDDGGDPAHEDDTYDMRQQIEDSDIDFDPMNPNGLYED